jgi:hypothetical protein
MKRYPIVLAYYFEYDGVRPKEKWRLALYRVDVRSASVDDLVRHDGIHPFTVDWLRMKKGWEANHDGEEDQPKHGETKLLRAMSWQTHPSAT